MRGLLVVAGLAALALVALAPSASAQGAGAQMQVRLVDLPTDPIVVQGDSSASATFSVELSGSNFACTGEGTFPVTVTLDVDAPPSDEFSVDPGQLNFTASPGTYSDANAYNESMEVTFTVSVTGPVEDGHTHEPAVTAEFLPDGVENCSSPGGFPSASDDGSFTVEMEGSGGNGTDGGTDGGADGGSDGGTDGDTDGGDDGNGIPGPGAAAAAAALAAGARARRRD